MLKIPATAEALATYAQFTSDRTIAVPMLAIAVCAMVFTARIAAAFSQIVLDLFSDFYEILGMVIVDHMIYHCEKSSHFYRI